MLTAVIQILLALFGGLLFAGTLLNFSKHPHWFIRIWDFPRVLVAGLAAATIVAYAIVARERWYDWALLAGLALVLARQLYMIFPYTALAPKVVKQADQTAKQRPGTLR